MRWAKWMDCNCATRCVVQNWFIRHRYDFNMSKYFECHFSETPITTFAVNLLTHFIANFHAVFLRVKIFWHISHPKFHFLPLCAVTSKQLVEGLHWTTHSNSLSSVPTWRRNLTSLSRTSWTSVMVTKKMKWNLRADPTYSASAVFPMLCDGKRQIFKATSSVWTAARNPFVFCVSSSNIFLHRMMSLHCSSLCTQQPTLHFDWKWWVPIQWGVLSHYHVQRGTRKLQRSRGQAVLPDQRERVLITFPSKVCSTFHRAFFFFFL